MDVSDVDNGWAFAALLAATTVNQITIMYGQRKARSARTRNEGALDEILSRASAAVDQLKNGHDVSVRVDMDRLLDGLEQLSHKMDTIGSLTSEQGLRIAGLRDDIRSIRTDHRTLEIRVAQLEQKLAWHTVDSSGQDRPT